MDRDPAEQAVVLAKCMTREGTSGVDRPGSFDDSAWPASRPAHLRRWVPCGGRDAPPIRVTPTLKPISSPSPKPGFISSTWAWNFGRAGCARPGAMPATARECRYWGDCSSPDGTTQRA